MRVLILANGAYGRRMAQMCRYSGRAHVVYETAEDMPPAPAEVARRLAEDLAITHVGVGSERHVRPAAAAAA